MARTIQTEGACVVRGALMYTLRASRMLGLAPVRMTRETGAGAWSVRITSRLLFYNYLRFLAIISIIFVTLQLLHAQEWPFGSVEVFVWTIELSRFGTVFLAGIGSVRARSFAIINSLNAIQKIHYEYKSDRLLRILRRKENVFVGVTLTYVIFEISLVFYYVNTEFVNGKMTGFMWALTINRVLIFVMLALVEAQFALTALRLNCALTAINDSIGGLLCFTESQSTKSSASYFIHVKSINAAVDCLKTEKQANENVPQIIIDIGENIRHVGVAYESVQKEVKELNDGFGFSLLIIYSFYLVYMTLAPYFIVLFLVKNSESTLVTIGRLYEMLMHLLLMFWGVEPGHELEQEVQRTNQVVSNLISRAPSSGERVHFQLNLLFKQLELGEPCYAPMGIFTLRRPLISAIITTTVTFTVVLLQMQGL